MDGLAGEAAAGQFTRLWVLKHKKAPMGAYGGMSLWTSRRPVGAGEEALEDDVVVDPGADADELALLATLPVPRYGECAVG